MPIASNDSFGGGGSITAGLKDLLVYGVKTEIDGRAAAKYGIGSFNDLDAVNAQGKKVQSAAPAPPSSFSEAALQLVSNPYLIGLGSALLVIGGLALLLRR